MRLVVFPLASLCGALLFAISPASADPVPRAAPAAGAVIATRTGEEIDFVEAPDWRGVEVLQDVKAGDVLRTNALGQIAILFSDQTQVRIGRNSTLIVKERVAGGDTRLQLTEGNLFARAARGGPGVFVETAAATAAIRGTDWTMQVNGDRTSLSVLEGTVEFANPQGSVTVSEGESAAATLGSAPSKVVIVATDVREQMLINMSLRGAFEVFPSTDLSNAEVTAAEARLSATPLARRTAEDRVIAAEIAIAREGRPSAVAAVAAARSVPLTGELDARVTVIEAMLAGGEQRYADAARLYEKALPRLTGEMRSSARYQAYFARSLADPTRALTPPPFDRRDRISVVGQTIITAFLETPRAALAIMREAEPQFRGDAEYQASLVQIAILCGDFETAKQALDRAVALDPASPDVLSARATYRAEILRDMKGARADVHAALALSPGDSGLWNSLGLLEDARGATRESEAAFRRAIELDPGDPVALVNFAILLLEEGRVAEARVLVDRALAVDPSFELSYLARGRQQVLEGDTEAAVESLLKATTANPGYANGLLLLGAVHASRGEIETGEQAMDNAERLDPKDPVTAQYRAALAIDQYRADDAITFAQQSVDRTRARGGDYTPIAATRDSGSTLGSAYRLLSLDAWGRYWGDVVFDPFSAGGYFDQALSGSVSPVVGARTDRLNGPDPVFDYRALSYLAQGLLLDPLALVGSNLRPSFIRAPLSEVEAGGGFTTSGGDWGGAGSASYQALGYAPLPYSALLSFSYDEVDPSFAEQDDRNFAGTAGFGLQVTPDDRLVGFFSGSRVEGGISLEPVPSTAADRSTSESLNGILGWSHTFGFRNLLNVAAFGTRVEQSGELNRADPDLGLFPAVYATEGEQESWKVGAAHSIGTDMFSLRYGGEFGHVRDESGGTVVTDFFGRPILVRDFSAASERDVGRIWVDGMVDLADNLKLEAALFGIIADDDDRSDLSPRIGAAWMPFEGQWLRAGFLREHPADDFNTLAPVGILGLHADALPIGTESIDTTILRWDSEWTDTLFTATEYQHQKVDGLTLDSQGYLTSLNLPSARIDRLSVTANLWLGHGFGAFGTVARLWSEGSLPGTEDAVPFIPDVLGRVGLTYVSPSRLKLTATETYLGDRISNVVGFELDQAWVTDVFGSWETPDRHLALDFGVYNLFDEDLEVAPLVPGGGRTVTATLKARF